MITKDKTLFGTKIYNHETKEIGIIIYTWFNRFAVNGGGYEDIPFATCVDSNGKTYNTKIDNIQPLEDLDEVELLKLRFLNR